MEDYCMECLQVNNAITRLVDKFGKKYYNEYRLEWIDWREEDLHYNFEINQDYWNIDEVYTALWFDIPREILFKYKEQERDKERMNLKNFYFMKKSNE